MSYQHFLIILIFLNVHPGLSDDFVTQTVYGFLDFTTTIGNTVMVFSPQSAPPIGKIELPVNIIETKPLNNKPSGSEDGIKPTKLDTTEKPLAEKPSSEPTTSQKTIVTVSSSSQSNVSTDTIIQLPEKTEKKKEQKDGDVYIENNVNTVEYDLLSRQPAEYAEESYRLVNLKTRNHDNPRAKANQRGGASLEASPTSHPVGVVTKLTGTELIDGVTTIHETSVIGTYISGKYAQVLQSTSNVQKNKKNKIRPKSSLRVLKTATPTAPKIVQSTSAQASPGRHSGANRLRNKNGSSTATSVFVAETTTEAPANPKSSRKSQTRSKSKRKNKGSRAHTTPKPATYTPEPASNRRSFRNKIQPSNIESDASTSVYMFKLNRTPGRWQYKTSPKPRVAIRKTEGSTNETPKNTALSIIDEINSDSPSKNSIVEQGDLESSGSQSGSVLNNLNQENNQKAFVETLNVEISTPADFKDTYYEIATIKTPYAFQAGPLKKTRFITVTSTIEKVIPPETQTAERDGPLTENILAASTIMPKKIGIIEDGSVTTLKALHLGDNEETPSLETVVESFSITQTKLRTQLLPIVRDIENQTSFITLVQTYDFTSLITVTKTLSPLESNQFNPSKSFKDFGDNLDEAGSEINLELEFGDEDNADDFNEEKPKHNEAEIALHTNAPPSLPFPQQQNINTPQGVPLSTVITTTRPVIKQETIWSTNVLPIVNGLSTSYRTLSKSIGVVDKTEYQVDVSTIALPSINSPPVSINPYLLPLPQQFQTITSSYFQPTIVTQTNSKILKLTFGAKTAYTTIFSTEVRPTTLTMLITTQVPVQPSAAFPGYFPPPFNPYAYLG